MDVSPTIQHLHGRIRSITGTDPAVNTEILETVPSRRRWKLLSIRISLTTDANPADRLLRLFIDNGTTKFLDVKSNTVQIAGKTIHYTFAHFGAVNLTQAFHFMVPLPSLMLTAGYRIQTLTTNLQATDNFSAPQLLVEEFIDP